MYSELTRSRNPARRGEIKKKNELRNEDGDGNETAEKQQV